MGLVLTVATPRIYLPLERFHYRYSYPEENCRLIKNKKIKMSEVGFEPTPTRVDCDLNAAP